MQCVQCNTVTKNPKFCSRTCSVTHKNLKSHWRAERGILHPPCVVCGQKIEAGTTWSNKCHQARYYKLRLDNWNETGKIGRGALRKYLLYKQHEKCLHCGIDKWNEKPITLEIEHIDGNADNNAEKNVCLLCPNCHSQTPTYKAKNKGNGRHFRRLRYQEGKSY